MTKGDVDLAARMRPGRVKREPVHAAANEAAIRHLAARLHDADLKLAVAVGNLAWKDALLRERDDALTELDELLAALDFDFIDDALKRRRDPRAAVQRSWFARLRATRPPAQTDTA